MRQFLYHANIVNDGTFSSIILLIALPFGIIIIRVVDFNPLFPVSMKLREGGY